MIRTDVMGSLFEFVGFQTNHEKGLDSGQAHSDIFGTDFPPHFEYFWSHKRYISPLHVAAYTDRFFCRDIVGSMIWCTIIYNCCFFHFHGFSREEKSKQAFKQAIAFLLGLVYLAPPVLCNNFDPCSSSLTFQESLRLIPDAKFILVQWLQSRFS